MAPPEQPNDLSAFLPNAPRPPTATSPWPPAVAPDGGTPPGGRTVMARREQIAAVARKMRSDLDRIGAQLDAMQAASTPVGNWDVARETTTAVYEAHERFVRGLREYYQAYAQAVRKLDQTVQTLNEAEQRSGAVVKSSVPTTDPSKNVSPW